MRREFVLVALLVCAICFAGCTKKGTDTSGSIEAISMETLTATVNATQAGEITRPEQLGASQMIKEPPLPPQGPYKPTAREIQSALKNAGYYKGNIDGKVGPLTKKAILEFQESNGLQADGKVGPKTWVMLGKYVNQPNE